MYAHTYTYTYALSLKDTPSKTSVVFVPRKNEAGVLFKASHTWLR